MLPLAHQTSHNMRSVEPCLAGAPRISSCMSAQCSRSPSVCNVRAWRRLRAPTGVRAAGAARAAAAAGPEITPYIPVKKADGYDLRLYQPYTVAETSYSRRDEGFLELGEYMSGGNAAGARMRETQPVVMLYSPDGSKRMQVRLVPREAPEGDAAAAAAVPPPQPHSPAVALEVAGGEVVAVARIEGNVTPEVAAAARQRLLAALQADGVKLAEAEAEGFFRIAQYGPMNSLTTRVNELWLRIQP